MRRMKQIEKKDVLSKKRGSKSERSNGEIRKGIVSLALIGSVFLQMGAWAASDMQAAGSYASHGFFAPGSAMASRISYRGPDGYVIPDTQTAAPQTPSIAPPEAAQPQPISNPPHDTVQTPTGQPDASQNTVDAEPMPPIEPVTPAWELEYNPYNTPPVIEARDIVLHVGDTFDPKGYARALDREDKSTSDELLYISENTVDTGAVGVYRVKYEYTDTDKATATKTIQVRIVSEEEELPEVIWMDTSDIELTVGDAFHPEDYEPELEGEFASYRIRVVQNEVDTQQAGQYLMLYETIAPTGKRDRFYRKVIVEDPNATEEHAAPSTVHDPFLMYAPLIEIEQGEEFYPLDYIKAYAPDDGKDPDREAMQISNQIQFSIYNVKPEQVGNYRMDFEIQAENGKKQKGSSLVHVRPAGSQLKQTYLLLPDTMFVPQNGELHLHKYVRAYDRVEGDVSDRVRLEEDPYINNKEVGFYPVNYMLTNSRGDNLHEVVRLLVYDKALEEDYEEAPLRTKALESQEPVEAAANVIAQENKLPELGIVDPLLIWIIGLLLIAIGLLIAFTGNKNAPRRR